MHELRAAAGAVTTTGTDTLWRDARVGSDDASAELAELDARVQVPARIFGLMRRPLQEAEVPICAL